MAGIIKQITRYERWEWPRCSRVVLLKRSYRKGQGTGLLRGWELTNEPACNSIKMHLICWQFQIGQWTFNQCSCNTIYRSKDILQSFHMPLSTYQFQQSAWMYNQHNSTSQTRPSTNTAYSKRSCRTIWYLLTDCNNHGTCLKACATHYHLAAMTYVSMLKQIILVSFLYCYHALMLAHVRPALDV